SRWSLPDCADVDLFAIDKHLSMVDRNYIRLRGETDYVERIRDSRAVWQRDDARLLHCPDKRHHYFFRWCFCRGDGRFCAFAQLDGGQLLCITRGTKRQPQ